jgi:hypothetical protein
MANAGRLTVVAVDTADITAPGDVGISATQISNQEVAFTVTPPNVDSDGTPLTGLTKIRVGIATANEDGTPKFTDTANFDNAAAAVVDIEVSGPDPVTGTLPIQVLGSTNHVAAYAVD